MKESKTPFERAVQDGFAIMTSKEQINQIDSLRKQEREFQERYDNLIYLFLGSALGIVGGYIATWIYEISHKGFSINLIDTIFCLIFVVLVILLARKLMDHRSSIEAIKVSKEVFEKNNVIITNQEKFDKYLAKRREVK